MAPVRPPSAEAVFDGEPGRPRTIIWLDDAQNYLLTEGSDLGEHIAARLRTLLTDPDRPPVLVLDTIRPTAWDQLMRQSSGAVNDPHQ